MLIIPQFAEMCKKFRDIYLPRRLKMCLRNKKARKRAAAYGATALKKSKLCKLRLDPQQIMIGMGADHRIARNQGKGIREKMLSMVVP